MQVDELDPGEALSLDILESKICSNWKSQLEMDFEPWKLNRSPFKVEAAQTTGLSNLIMLIICVRYLQGTAHHLTAAYLRVPDSLTFPALFESLHRPSVDDSGHRHCINIFQGFEVTVTKKRQLRQYHVQKLDETRQARANYMHLYCVSRCFEMYEENRFKGFKCAFQSCSIWMELNDTRKSTVLELCLEHEIQGSYQCNYLLQPTELK